MSVSDENECFVCQRGRRCNWYSPQPAAGTSKKYLYRPQIIFVPALISFALDPHTHAAYWRTAFQMPARMHFRCLSRLFFCLRYMHSLARRSAGI